MASSDIDADFDALSRENSKLKQLIKRMKEEEADEIDQLTQNLKDSERKFKSEIRNKNEEIDELKDIIEDLNREINMLKKRSRSSCKMSDSESSLEETELKTKEIDQLKEELSRRVEMIQDMEKQLDSVKEDLNSSRLQNNDLINNIKSLEMEIIKQQQQVREKDKEVSKLVEEKSVFRELKAQWEADKEKFETTNRNNDEAGKLLKTVIDGINDITQNSFKDPNECLSYVQKIYNRSQARLQSSVGKDGGKDQNLQMLLTDNEELQDKIAGLERKYRNSEKALKRNLDEKDSEIEELTEELDKIKKNKAKDIQKKVSALQKEKDEIEANLADKNREFVFNEKKLKESIKCNKEKSGEIDALQNQVRQLETTNKLLKQKIDKLKMEIDNQGNMIHRKDEELTNIKNDVDKLRWELDEKMAVIAKCDEKITETLTDLDDVRRELDAELNVKSMLLEQLDDRNAKVTMYEKKIKNLENEIQAKNMGNYQRKHSSNSAGLSKMDCVGIEYINGLPAWWEKHKSKRPVDVACPNCNLLLGSQYELNEHLKNCLMVFD